MEKFFSIGEAAEMVGMTAETLRHYDRIGLIRPHKTDEWTKYRYYTEREIVLLETVRALRCMELPLNEIRQLLQCDDVAKIAAFLQNAEAHADEKIAQLREAKERIGRAKRFYEGKAAEQPKRGGIYACRYPARVILLSHTLRTPTVENLHDYHRHFYAQVGQARRGEFAFADTAGIYEAEGDPPRMFAVCERFAETDGLRTLPAGEYLCAECAENDLPSALRTLKEQARAQYGAAPAFTLRFIVLSGILRWKYRIELPLGTA